MNRGLELLNSKSKGEGEEGGGRGKREGGGGVTDHKNELELRTRVQCILHCSKRASYTR